jgi:hypothetical protein
MFELISGYWKTQIVASIARFGVADAIAGGVTGSKAIAERTGANAGARYRLLRAAATLGLVEEKQNDQFALTPLGETLRADVPGSMRDIAIANAAPGHWLPWGAMDQVIRTGERATKTVLEMEIWEWYAQHPDEAVAFSRAMTNTSAIIAEDVAKTVDLSGRRIVDVGGAHGTLLTKVVTRSKDSRGVIYDLGHVVDSAKKVIASQNLSDRIECVAGDFFKSVPAGQAYLLKHILHDWNDDECRTILSNCSKSADANARLVVVELVLPEDRSPSRAALMDVNMMVLLTGRERTLSEYRDLFSKSGWKFERAHALETGHSILEAVRA